MAVLCAAMELPNLDHIIMKPKVALADLTSTAQRRGRNMTTPLGARHMHTHLILLPRN
jgi:hypothetical protein